MRNENVCYRGSVDALTDNGRRGHYGVSNRRPVKSLADDQGKQGHFHQNLLGKR